MPICLHIVYSHFHSTLAELNSYNGDCEAPKAGNIYISFKENGSKPWCNFKFQPE